MSTELTPAQTRVLGYIRAYIVANDYSPTRAEIATAMGYRSANAAHDHLQALQRKGHIKLIPDVARGIRLAAMPTEQMSMMDVLADTVQPLHRPTLHVRKV